jgi:predicted acyltransferase
MILVATPPSPAETEPKAVSDAPPAPVNVKAGRLVSLDALRGFDMIWIIGGEVLIEQLAKLFPPGRTTVEWPKHPGEFITVPLEMIRLALAATAAQLQHVSWEGFHAYDLIFPMFVFIVGVSLVFSLSKQLTMHGRSAAVRRVIIRGIILYLLGLIYYGGLSSTYQQIRLMGVLQRIAISYTFAGLLFCYLRPRGLALVTAGILIGYYLLLAFVPVPKVGHASFVEGQNWPNYIDSHFLPFRKWDGDHDPEGLLSNLPAIAGCLLGVFAGLLLRSPRPRPLGKFAILLVAGVACGALGYAWGHAFPQAPRLQFPIIKKIWTSSFVLVTAGYASVLLALFYLVIDIFKLQFWARPFVWIGTNAITLYLAWAFFRFSAFANRFVGGQFAEHALKSYAGLVNAFVSLALVLLLARFLYKRQIFLRV